MVKVVEESFGKFVRVVPPEELGVKPTILSHVGSTEAKTLAPKRPRALYPMEPGYGFPTIYEESFGGVTRRVVSIEEINAAIVTRNAPKP